MRYSYDITPIAKPRMTQRDKWAQRPCVMKYRAYCDEVRAKGIEIPESGSHVTFILPMPKSWSKKKRSELAGKEHRQRPDWDNLAKALMDAVLKEDSGVWDIRVTKLWGDRGQIILEV